MICPCGCLMCYICREPYPNCPHFKTETHEENDLSIAYSTNEGFPKTLSEETKNSRAEYNCEVESSSTFLDRSTDLSPNFVSSDSEVY